MNYYIWLSYLKPILRTHFRYAVIYSLRKNSYYKLTLFDTTCFALQKMQKDLEYLKWLSLFHYIGSALSFLFSGLIILQSYGTYEEAKEIAAKNNNPSFVDSVGMMIFIFTVVYLAVELARIVCTILVGYFLQQRKHRIFCIIISGINCAFFPLGTVLGVFTLIVLFRELVKGLFSEQAQKL